MNDKQLARLANDPIASLKYGSALKVRFHFIYCLLIRRALLSKADYFYKIKMNFRKNIMQNCYVKLENDYITIVCDHKKQPCNDFKKPLDI